MNWAAPFLEPKSLLFRGPDALNPAVPTFERKVLVIEWGRIGVV